jgi:hypothetical protein
MIDRVCGSPLTFGEIADYVAGDLEPEAERRVEEHYFSCEACARRIEAVELLGRGIADAVGAGLIGGWISGDTVERLRRQGLRLREYRLQPGVSVNCTAAPADDLVLLHLHGDFGEGPAVVDVEFEDLSTGSVATHRDIEVSVDREHRRLTLVSTGDTIRAYPRSRWTMRVRGAEGAGAPVGPFVLDHTPWEERGAED